MRKQRSPDEFGFDRYDKIRLQNALQKVDNERTFRRLNAVLLFAEGMNVHSVAKIAGRSVRIVYQWINLYLKNHDPHTLCDSVKTGRPTAAKKITAKRILRELKRNPLLLGYNATVWTVALLAKHLSELYACEIRPRTLYRRMKHIGLRCKRPKYVYSEKDPNRAQKKGRLSES